jgi:hypothetical protein
MTSERVYRGGRPRPQGRKDDPLVTVSLQLRKHQLAELDQLADAEHTSRAGVRGHRSTTQPPEACVIVLNGWRIARTGVEEEPCCA